ncbi:MAG: CaiB/BaiF CoA transferase family protein [Acidimicrobiales bacterium]
MPVPEDQPSPSSGPLSDVVVVELAHALAGPHAAMMLGDLGARVIKVERPGVGDESRCWGPPFVGPEETQESTYFLSCNRNKESITLDLSARDDGEVFKQLINRADVLVTNFRPGVAERLGFGFQLLQEINPRLVILSITGFGHGGPESGRPGYDQIAQGEAGLMSVTGPGPDEPTKVGVPIADVLAGINGAYGVVAALHERERTGCGKVVRTSLLAGIIGAHAYLGTAWTVAGELPRAGGNHHPSIAPYGTFVCADGPIQLAVGSDGLWRRFAPLVNTDPADERFATNADRVRNREELIRVIEAALAGRLRDHWLARLAEVGVPAGTVRSFDQVYAWDQVLSQELLVEAEHSSLGRISLPGPPLSFDNGPTTVHRAPPTLGQHNEAIRSWLRVRETETGGS